MPHIAGSYSATYGGLSLGQIDDGFDLDYNQIVEAITSDEFRARQDGVFQGLEVATRFVLNEPDLAAVRDLSWPWDGTMGTTGEVGRLLKALAKPLILTKCGSGGSQYPNSITFLKAILWTDRVNTKFANTQRKVSVNVASLPIANGSSSGVLSCAGGVFFTTT
jgi:hypothetical protein